MFKLKEETVAQRRSDHIQQALTSVLPRQRIRDMARRLGVVQRRRKLDIVALVYSLVLGFASGDRRSLSGLRRSYFRATAMRLAPSSFYARFTPGLTKLMRALAMSAIRQFAERRPKLRDVFAPFVEVLAIDSALIRLHDALEDFYPSVWSHYMKASVKLTVVMNVIGRGPTRVGISHGSRHDVHLLKPGRLMRGRLLLFDLGFFSAVLFQRIDDFEGYFLSRARKHANPIIVHAHRRGQKPLVGLKLRDALEQVRDGIVDVDAEMGYMLDRSPYTHYRVRFRYVAVYNSELERWHCYVTNLPLSAMKAEHFAAVYAARWEVELLFRELKSHYRIDQMPSANKHITETLIFAALLSLVLSRKLYRSVTTRYRLDPQRLPFDRWAMLLAQVAHQLLTIALGRRSRPHHHARLERFLSSEAIDPNRARIPLPARAEAGLCLRA